MGTGRVEKNTYLRESGLITGKINVDNSHLT